MAKGLNKTVERKKGSGYFRHYSPVTKMVERCTGDCLYGQNSTISVDGREFVVLHADSAQELMEKIEHYEAAEAKKLGGNAGVFGTQKRKKKAPKLAEAPVEQKQVRAEDLVDVNTLADEISKRTDKAFPNWDRGQFDRPGYSGQTEEELGEEPRAFVNEVKRISLTHRIGPEQAANVLNAYDRDPEGYVQLGRTEVRTKAALWEVADANAFDMIEKRDSDHAAWLDRNQPNVDKTVDDIYSRVHELREEQSRGVDHSEEIHRLNAEAVVSRLQGINGPRTLYSTAALASHSSKHDDDFHRTTLKRIHEKIDGLNSEDIQVMYKGAIRDAQAEGQDFDPEEAEAAWNEEKAQRAADPDLQPDEPSAGQANNANGVDNADVDTRSAALIEHETKIEAATDDVDRIILSTTQRVPGDDTQRNIEPEQVRELAKLTETSFARMNDTNLDSGSRKQANEAYFKITAHAETLKPDESSGYDPKAEYLNAQGLADHYAHFESVPAEKPEQLNHENWRPLPARLRREGKEVTDETIVEKMNEFSDETIMRMAAPTAMASLSKANGDVFRKMLDKEPDDYSLKTLRDSPSDSDFDQAAKSVVRDYAKKHKMTQKAALSRLGEALNWGTENYRVQVNTEQSQVAKYLAKQRGLI